MVDAILLRKRPKTWETKKKKNMIPKNRRNDTNTGFVKHAIKYVFRTTDVYCIKLSDNQIFKTLE